MPVFITAIKSDADKFMVSLDYKFSYEVKDLLSISNSSPEYESMIP